MIHSHLLRRPADGAPEQMGDALLQHPVGRKPDGVTEAFRFEEVVNLRHGEGRVGPKVAPELPVPVAYNDRLQYVAPVVGAVYVAGPKHAPPQIAEPMEHEQRVIAREGETAVVGRFS